MTITPRQPERPPATDHPEPRRAGGDLVRPAVARLIAGSARGEAEIDRFLFAAEAHGIDLMNLWATFSPDGRMAREAALVVPGAGRGAMVFTSAPESGQAIRELSNVIECATADSRFEGQPSLIAQALLQPEEEAAEQAFLQAGWMRVGELAYLRRRFQANDADLPKQPAQVLDEGFVLEACGRDLDADLAQALESSYIDTLDCPELCGLRETRDVIASHRATGHFDPDLWWLLREKGVPVGVMLFNPNPEQDAIELVYIGLAPSVRGRGLSRRLLKLAIARLARYPGREITCAVDLRNRPARNLYQSLGFRPFGRRVAMIKHLAMDQASLR